MQVNTETMLGCDDELLTAEFICQGWNGFIQNQP